MSSLLIQGGTVLTPFDAIEDGAVLARDGIIERVGAHTELAGERADVEVNASGRIVCPGFIDLQVNGGGGTLLTEEPNVEALERMTRAHVRFGTTSMLPTVVTANEDRLERALAAVRDAMRHARTGSRILGAHLEGPFINPARKGAHDERFILPPRREALDRLLGAADGALKLVTLAPELPGALDLIVAARAAGVLVAIGHTDATYEEAMRAIEAGARLGTHIFNAMRPLAQREPGVAGALLQSELASVSVIADGVHAHPAVLGLVARAKGAAATVLVTDAMSPVGTGATSFRLGDREIVVRNWACYTEDGVLAGSALSMNEAVRRMARLAGVAFIDCVRMATATPARVLGLEGEIGVLAPGARADIVVCDGEMNVWKTFVDGELAYDAE